MTCLYIFVIAIVLQVYLRGSQIRYFILPDMRGADVCQKLIEDPSTADIPVVLISAKGAEIRQAYENIPSVVSYITKPFTPAGVTSVIDEAIASSQAPAPAAEAEAPAAAFDMPNGAPAPAVEEDDFDTEWEAPEDQVVETRMPSGAGRAGLDPGRSSRGGYHQAVGRGVVYRSRRRSELDIHRTFLFLAVLGL